MAAVAAVNPVLTGVVTAPTTVAAGAHTITGVVPGRDYLMVINNGDAAARTITLEDINTPVPEGSAASSTFADVTISVPNGQRRAVRFNSARFTDGNGVVGITAGASSAAVSVEVFGPL